MTDVVSAAPVDTGGPSFRRRRLLALTGAVLFVLCAIGLVLVLTLGSGGNPPATDAARLVPADALAYVNVSLDNRRPAVDQALRVAGRLPDYPLASAAVQSRLGSILSGGHTVDFGGQVLPWLGNEAALALLNTSTSTAGSLILLDVRRPSQARSFLRSEGATSAGSYGGHALYSYSSGTTLAFVSHFLLVGQQASVQSAIDVANGHSAALSGSAPYQRASSDEPDGRVIDAYLSLAGVQRVLSPQGGVIGALGGLLYQPALQGVAVSVSPASGGAHVYIHSALDPNLVKVANSGKTGQNAFTPSLQSVMPDGSMLVLDVRGLNRVAPQVLGAGATAGIAGGLGPLLSRLGRALRAEGVSTQQLTSIFAGETAVAIIPHKPAPTLVVVARTNHPAQVRSALAQLEVPLAQLFKPPKSGSGRVPQFVTHTVGGVTYHELVLASGLGVDYAVFGKLVVISTSAEGIAAVVQRTRSLAADPGYRFSIGANPGSVTSLVYASLPTLLTLAEQTGLGGSARYRQLKPDLQAIHAVGLTSHRSGDSATTRLSLQIP